MGTYRISELAESSGVPTTTLRFYDASGLLPARRSTHGHRIYDEKALHRLELINAAKRLGLSLEEIAALLTIRDREACVEVKHELADRLSAHRTEVAARHAELHRHEDELRTALRDLDHLPDRPGPCDSECELPGQRNDGTTLDHTPVACSLNGEDVRQRRGRWRSALAGASRQRISRGLRITLSVGASATVADLAAAEQECCPFFDFTLRFDGPRLHLDVQAPVEGQPMLEELFGDATTDSGSSETIDPPTGRDVQ